MSANGGKLLQYVISGYSVSSCTRDGRRRVIKLKPPVLKVLSTSLDLDEPEYRAEMSALIEYLLQQQARGVRVEVQSGHFGHEWIEVRDSSGRTKTKLALSSRTIHTLKERLMSATPTAGEAPQAAAR